MKRFCLSFMLCLLPSLVNAACVSAPDCASLGYTKTAAGCTNGGVKCPFDTNKMFCLDAEQVEEPEPEKQVCKVGDILYSDMTCDAKKITGKTAIGVVGMVNGTDYVALSLTGGDCPWSKDKIDVPGIINISNGEAHRTDFSGKQNTAAWIAYYGDSGYSYAPSYCYNYTTAGTKKGDWYLPAIGELYIITVENKAAVNATRSLLGKASLGPLNYFLSSSELSAYNIHIISKSSTPYGTVDKDRSDEVYCAISF